MFECIDRVNIPLIRCVNAADGNGMISDCGTTALESIIDNDECCRNCPSSTVSAIIGGNSTVCVCLCCAGGIFAAVLIRLRNRSAVRVSNGIGLLNAITDK